VVVGDLDPDVAPAGIEAYPLDVRSAGSFEDFLSRTGPLDVLVNNAGVACASAFVDTPAALRQIQLDVNLGGVVNGMAAVLPGMIARGHGHIVNVASLAGRVPTPHAAIYTATKHAVIGLTEAVRAEVRAAGVRLTAICPTFAPTEMTQGLNLRGIPTTTPEAVAAAVVRAVRRGGPAVVVVPRWLGALPRLSAWTPQLVKDLLTRGAAGQPPADGAPERAGYAARVRAQVREPDA
jgi:short-subunit dehydrogenase